jgi:hypothetical protein
VAPGEYQRNAVVWLWFKDLSVAAATAKGQGKHWSPGKVLSGFGASQTLQGAHWMVMTWHYGVDAPILAQAVATYAADPAVRKGLEEHLKLPG